MGHLDPVSMALLNLAHKPTLSKQAMIVFNPEKSTTRSELNTVRLINAVMLVRRHPGCCDVLMLVRRHLGTKISPIIVYLCNTY